MPKKSNSPWNFLWLLEKMDVPYIPNEWNVLREKAYAKDPYKMNGMSVFGKYLSKMKLKQWKQYTWADTEALQAKAKEEEINYRAQHPEMDEKDKKIKEMYEQGLISEAQYKTYMNQPESMYKATLRSANSIWKNDQYFSFDSQVQKDYLGKMSEWYGAEEKSMDFNNGNPKDQIKHFL